MANLVVTSTTECFKVVFNDMASTVGMDKGTWQKKWIHLELSYGSTMVVVRMEEFPPWQISFDGSSNTFQVDSIDGVAPTSNSDLYDKLVTLLG